MSEGTPSDRLHLPDLSIKGFRGIDNLSIPRMARVTLLAGRNGVGKTTVLEACRVYAARGHFSVLSELARGHEEYSAVTDEDGNRISMPNIEALFHGRDPSLTAGLRSVQEEIQLEIISESRSLIPVKNRQPIWKSEVSICRAGTCGCSRPYFRIGRRSPLATCP